MRTHRSLSGAGALSCRRKGRGGLWERGWGRGGEPSRLRQLGRLVLPGASPAERPGRAPRRGRAPAARGLRSCRGVVPGPRAPSRLGKAPGGPGAALAAEAGGRSGAGPRGSGCRPVPQRGRAGAGARGSRGVRRGPGPGRARPSAAGAPGPVKVTFMGPLHRAAAGGPGPGAPCPARGERLGPGAAPGARGRGGRSRPGLREPSSFRAPRGAAGGRTCRSRGWRAAEGWVLLQVRAAAATDKLESTHEQELSWKGQRLVRHFSWKLQV